MIGPFEDLSFPQRLTLELTNRCNLGCCFCPRHQADMDLGDMDMALFRRLIDEAAKHRPVSLVVFFRGESLLHPQLGAMIRQAKNLGLGPVQLASNGLLLTRELAGELLASGLDFISFSLDTNDESLYQKARVRGDLALARANILHFIELARRMENPPEIQISGVDHPDYQPGQADFIDFWRKRADKVRIYEEHSADGRFGSLESAANDGLERKPCLKVFREMVVYWNGRAALCNHDWNNQSPLGDLTRQTIAEVWNSPAYQAVRAFHESGRFPDGLVCGDCDHWRMYYTEDGFLGKIYDRAQ